MIAWDRQTGERDMEGLNGQKAIRGFGGKVFAGGFSSGALH